MVLWLHNNLSYRKMPAGGRDRNQKRGVCDAVHVQRRNGFIPLLSACRKVDFICRIAPLVHCAVFLPLVLYPFWRKRTETEGIQWLLHGHASPLSHEREKACAGFVSHYSPYADFGQHHLLLPIKQNVFEGA